MNDKVIVGITAFNHDSSATLIKNGKVVAFSEEERFNHVKHTGAFPSRAIEYCLKEAKITSSDITDIAFYFHPRYIFGSYLRNNNPVAYIKDFSLFTRKRYYFEFISFLDFVNKINTIKKQAGNTKAKLHFVRHHLAHVWSGYYASGFEDCLVLSNDSQGEGISSLAMEFKKPKEGIITKEVFKQDDPHSLGYLYGAVTEFLGFERDEGEGRVMALASFGTGKYQDYFEEGVTLLPQGKFLLNDKLIVNRNFEIKAQRVSDRFLKTFGSPRKKGEPLEQKHYCVAFGLQSVFEKIVLHQLQYLRKYKKVVMTGGTAQNSVLNGKAMNLFPNTEFFVSPIPHDAGCSLGAAVYIYYQYERGLPQFSDVAFLGPSFSDDEIIGILKNNQIKHRIIDNPVAYVVENIIRNKTVGIFRSRMECGPRALCNRSILASANTPKMRDHLNNRVKYREFFRPYGGFIMDKEIERIVKFNNKHKKGPYMSYVFPVKKSWLKKIPSLVHIDNTCRVQIVRSGQDPFLENVLRQFTQRTGVPIIINTSMNVRGFPIARSPIDALSTFYGSALDGLLFNEKILIEK